MKYLTLASCALARGISLRWVVKYQVGGPLTAYSGFGLFQYQPREQARLI